MWTSRDICGQIQEQKCQLANCIPVYFVVRASLVYPQRLVETGRSLSHFGATIRPPNTGYCVKPILIQQLQHNRCQRCVLRVIRHLAKRIVSEVRDNRQNERRFAVSGRIREKRPLQVSIVQTTYCEAEPETRRYCSGIELSHPTNARKLHARGVS